MNSNPKTSVTIVRPDLSLRPSQRRTRVFVGDVEIPVHHAEIVDAFNGAGSEVQLTLRVDELHLVDTAPTRVEPEQIVHIFKADPGSIVMETGLPEPMRRWGARFPPAQHTVTFNDPIPGREAATVTVSVPSPKPADD